MKKIISLFFLIVPALLSGSCVFNRDRCMSCEIYDDYGSYREYYGNACGNSRELDDYEEEAGDYAWDYYYGYAICYDE